MAITKNNMLLIIQKIGRIRSPNYDTIAYTLNENESFTGEITAEEVEKIHSKVIEIGDNDVAVTLLSESHDSSEPDPASEYILDRKKRLSELAALKDIIPTAVENRAITEYHVVRKKMHNDLIKLVNDHIANGWEPMGGVSFASAGMSPLGDTGNSFIQAMVRYK